MSCGLEDAGGAKKNPAAAVTQYKRSKDGLLLDFILTFSKITQISNFSDDISDNLFSCFSDTVRQYIVSNLEETNKK